MRGRLLYNYQLFEDAANWLRCQGYHVISPHELDIDYGYVTADWYVANGKRVYTKVELTDKFDIYQVMRLDLRLITQVDAVVFLPGWQGSSGSKMEDTVREFCGVPRWLLTPTDSGWLFEQPDYCDDKAAA